MLYKVIPVKSKGIEQPRDFPTQFACKYAQIQKKIWKYWCKHKIKICFWIPFVILHFCLFGLIYMYLSVLLLLQLWFELALSTIVACIRRGAFLLFCGCLSTFVMLFYLGNVCRCSFSAILHKSNGPDNVHIMLREFENRLSNIHIGDVNISICRHIRSLYLLSFCVHTYNI